MELQLTASQKPLRIGRHVQEFGRNGDFDNAENDEQADGDTLIGSGFQINPLISFDP